MRYLPPSPGAYNSQASGTEWGGDLRTLAKGPGPDIPAPPFLLLLPWEGEALGRRDRKGKWPEAQTQPPSLPAGPCSNPRPGEGTGRARSTQADQESPAQGSGVQQVWPGIT